MDLDYDPTKGIRPLDTSTWHTYTEEEPNSLTVDEVPRFVACAGSARAAPASESPSPLSCWRSCSGTWTPFRPGPMRESELLFPSTLGGYRAPSCLDKPI